MIDLSRPDWRERITTGRSLMPDVHLDRDMADMAIRAFNALRLPDVPNQPLLAEAAGDWFREIVAAVFGTSKGQTTPREVREFFILVAKKSSKTSGAAALMLTALLLNRRPRAEFLLVGPTQDISKLAYSQSVGMIETDQEGFLQKRLHVRDHLKEIVDRTTKSVLKIKTFDTNVMTGVKPTGVLVDELHEISRNHEAGRVIGQIRGGMVANPEAFLVFITTQSDTVPQGAFRDELRKARAIRDGRQPGTMLPVLYEFPENILHAARPGSDAPWYDNRLWWMVTPNRGRSVHIPRLIEEFEIAKATGVHELARWASQHLNIEIGIGLRTDQWTGVEYWDRRADPELTYEVVLERSDAIVVGIDGGGLDDLFGLAVLGRDKDSREWLLWSHGWCHTGVLERRKQIAPRLLDFAAAGELTIVDDRLDDILSVSAIIRQIKDTDLLAAVAIDPAAIGELVDALAEIDVTQANEMLVGVGQGYRMMSAIKTTERRLATGTLRHSGSSLMAWCVSNLRIEPTATAIRATKQYAGDAKIDLAMAMFDAIDVMSTNPSSGASIYTTAERADGFLVL
jgi:phage terminase large subunit-like protein